MRYQPSPALPEETRDEFRRIADNFKRPDVEGVILAELNAVPAKVFEGLTVRADGTNWNPGAGRGVYCYQGGAWTFLG